MKTRVLSFELVNFKSVKRGNIQFNTSMDSYDFSGYNPDILGFYGQNGSGKTSSIEALKVLKILFSGVGLDKKTIELIYSGSDSCELKTSFLMMGESKTARYYVDYYVMIKKNNDNQSIINIEKEELSISVSSEVEEEKQSKVRIIFDNTKSVVNFISPGTRMSSILGSNKDNVINLNVIRNESYLNSASFLFNPKFYKYLNNEPLFHHIIFELTNFARFKMMIIDNKDFGSINLNQLLHIPFAGQINTSTLVSGDWYVSLFNEGSIELKLYDPFLKLIEQINLVIHSFIPDLRIECLWNNGIDEKGNQIKKYEFLSCREGRNPIPLRLESDGVKKLISICNGLISFYNDASFFLAIDEMDSGVFEYLLGEILDVLKTGKGQFLFTAHNLRPLEVMDTVNIYMTTTDPLERYIRFNKLGPTNNLRDKYLRYIFMGDYSKPLYLQTETSELSYALRKAGKIEIQ